MRVVWRLLLGLVVLVALVVAGAAGFWWLGGAEAHRWAARLALETALGREVEVDGTLEVELGAEPLFRLIGLRIDAPAWAEVPSLLRIERAEVSIALRPLLRRILVLPKVALEGVSLDLETTADGRRNWVTDVAEADQAVETDLALPLLESVSVEDATVIYRDQQSGRRTEVTLTSLTDRRDPYSGGMRLDGDGAINGNRFQISGTSGSLEMALAATAPYPLAVDLQLPAIDASLDGVVADVVQGEGLNVRLEANSRSLQAAARAWGLELPVDPGLAASARLSGDLDALAMTDLSAQLTNAGGDHLDLRGGLDDAWTGSGLDLQASLKLDLQGEVRQLLPEDWRLMDQLEATAKVGGSIGAPVLDDLLADLRGPGTSSSTVAGQIRFGDAGLDGFDLATTFYVAEPQAFATPLGFDPTPLGPLRGEADLTLADRRLEASRVEFHADDLGTLQVEAHGALGTVADDTLQLAPDLALTAKLAKSGPLLAVVDAQLPELGPADASGQLRHDEHGYRLDQIELHMGTDGAPTLSAKGSLGPLVATDIEATELDLAVEVGWPSSGSVRSLLGADLPELGKAEGKLGLGGTIGQLAISDGRFETKNGDGVALTVTGGATSVQTVPPFAVEGAAFVLQGQAPSTTAAARLLEHELPDLGPVQVRADMGVAGQKITLSGIQLTTGSIKEPTIEVTGRIGDLLGFRKADLQGTLEIPTHELLALVDIAGKPALGRVHGEARLSDADGSMGVERIEAEVKETDLLSMTLKGEIGDLDSIDQVRFETSIEVPSLANLADVFDADATGLERFQYDGKLSGGGTRFDADGQAVLGETRIDGMLTGSFEGPRPSFQGHLRSPGLRLADLGLTPDASDATKAQPTAAPATELFGRDPLPLEQLQTFDLDLGIEIESLKGIAFDVDRATAQIKLADGVLQLEPLRFGFVGGHAELNADVDAHEAVPTWRIDAEADDVGLGKAWRQLETDVPLSGNLDLVLDLQAKGRSPRDLASSLAGKLSFALDRGKLQSRLFRLTAANPLRWLLASSTRSGHVKVDCLVGRFQVDEGIANATKLVLDTPDVIATGEGNIDLAKETLDLRIQPSARQSRLADLATPFTITGSLASPSVEISTSGAAARLVGEVALSPLNLLGSLLPFASNRGRDQDNPCLVMSLPDQ